MVTIKCRYCKAKGVKFYTHGKKSKPKKFIKHKKGCRLNKND